MQPLRTGYEELGGRTTYRKSEMVCTDDTFADHTVAWVEAGHLLPDRDDLSRPFMAGYQRVGERDDVSAFEQVDVGVAHAHRTRRDEYFVVGDLWGGQFGHRGDAALPVLQCFHVYSCVSWRGPGPSPGRRWVRAAFRNRMRRCRPLRSAP